MVVNIRSCFSNKYWVPHPDSTKTFKGIAAADKPLEDKLDPKCTLFRVSADYTSDGTPGFQFFTVGTARKVDYNGFQLKLQDDQDQPDVQYTFLVVNWEDLVILPSQVSFKSQVLDGNYLGSGLTKGVNYHKFESGFDIGNPQVGYELVPAANGNYRIKSLNYGKYWRGGSEWVVADAEDYSKSDDTLFSFIKISDNVVAIRSLGTNKFCGAKQGDKFLRTDYQDITNDTRITVEERVMKRKISHVRYRLGDSKIHDEVVQEVASEIATNDSPDKEAEASLKSSQTRSVTTTWNNSESLSFGTSVSVGLEVSEVPLVANSTFQVELSTEYGSTHEWGESKTTQTQTEASYTIKVHLKLQ
ncbi:uncharacterized protein LOC143597418 [Bidens hawaiensis]|uniref:uncharacterized protein LOC143597418 n=1 Tax=Bidens hawaiensis TaxID=980011 RepID=UPI00404A3508